MFRMDRITGAKIFDSDQSDKRGLHCYDQIHECSHINHAPGCHKQRWQPCTEEPDEVNVSRPVLEPSQGATPWLRLTEERCERRVVRLSAHAEVLRPPRNILLRISSALARGVRQF